MKKNDQRYLKWIAQKAYGKFGRPKKSNLNPKIRIRRQESWYSHTIIVLDYQPLFEIEAI